MIIDQELKGRIPSNGSVSQLKRRGDREKPRHGVIYHHEFFDSNLMW